MAKCPKCNSNITFGQLSRYNWWNPIVCQSCKAKLDFNKKEYIKNVANLLFASFIMILITIAIYARVIDRNKYALLIILGEGLLIFSLIRYFVSMKSIKLELKEEKIAGKRRSLAILILGIYSVLVGLTTSIVNFIVTLAPMIARREWVEDGAALFLAAFTARFLKVIFIANIFFGGVLILRLKEIGRIISVYSYSIVILISLALLIVEGIIFRTPVWDGILILLIIYGIPIIALTRPKVKDQFK